MNGEITAGMRIRRHRVTTTAVMMIIMTIVGMTIAARVTIIAMIIVHHQIITDPKKSPALPGFFDASACLDESLKPS